MKHNNYWLRFAPATSIQQRVTKGQGRWGELYRTQYYTSITLNEPISVKLEKPRPSARAQQVVRDVGCHNRAPVPPLQKLTVSLQHSSIPQLETGSLQ